MRFRILIFSYAILLFLDGVVFQLIADVRDPAILQPVLFSGIILLMGFLTLKQDFQLYAKHGAAALSVVAFASSVAYLNEIIKNFPDALNFPNISNSVMNILSLIFLILAVIQFARERRNKAG